jgi:serine protease Do
MRKLIVGALAVVLLLVLAAMVAPTLWAQVRGRVFPAPPDTLLLQGPGPSIGVSVRDLTADEVSKAQLSQPGGAVVTGLIDNSPASKAGLKSGDIVVEFDGERVRSSRHLTRLVQETAPGRTVKMSIVREGSRQTLDVTPEARGRLGLNGLPDIQQQVQRGLRNLPRNFSFDFNPPDGAIGRRGRLGAVLSPLSDQLGSYFGVKQGVLVSAVEDNSPAMQAGLKAGDVITAVNGHTVESPGDVANDVRGVQPGASFEIRVTRDRKEMTLKAVLPQRGERRRRDVLPV